MGDSIKVTDNFSISTNVYEAIAAAEGLVLSLTIGELINSDNWNKELSKNEAREEMSKVFSLIIGNALNEATKNALSALDAPKELIDEFERRMMDGIANDIIK